MQKFIDHFFYLQIITNAGIQSYGGIGHSSPMLKHLESHPFNETPSSSRVLIPSRNGYYESPHPIYEEIKPINIRSRPYDMDVDHESGYQVAAYIQQRRLASSGDSLLITSSSSPSPDRQTTNKSTQSEESFMKSANSCECCVESTNGGRESGYATEGISNGNNNQFGTWGSMGSSSPGIGPKRTVKDVDLRFYTFHNSSGGGKMQRKRKPHHVERPKPLVVYSNEANIAESQYV